MSNSVTTHASSWDDDVKSSPSGHTAALDARERAARSPGRRAKRAFLCMALVAVSASVAACGSSSSGSGGGGGGSGLQVAVVAPFTGPDAAFGPLLMGMCVPGADTINANGGVLGHKLNCTSNDTHGDTADAVPVVSKILANGSNLAGVIGPTSDEATTVVPIFNRAKVPMFVASGQAEFDRVHFQYFWRLLAPDGATGIAEALWARNHLHASRVAAVYVLAPGGTVPVANAITAFKHLGGTVVLNQRLTAGSSSYNAEVAQLIRSNPQAVLFYADAQTAATYLSELKQQGGLRWPFVSSEAAAEVQWVKAVGEAIGQSNLTHFVAVENYVKSIGTPGWAAFRNGISAARKQLSGYSSESLTDPYEMSGWDGMNLMALAMLEKHSTDPALYNSAIPGLIQPGPGKTVVHTFQEGKKALAAGKQIQYVGATGPIVLDAFHTRAGDQAAFTLGPNSHPVGIVSASQITPLLPLTK